MFGKEGREVREGCEGVGDMVVVGERVVRGEF